MHREDHIIKYKQVFIESSYLVVCNESKGCDLGKDELIGESVGGDVLAARLVAVKEAARLGVLAEVVLVGAEHLAGSVYTEETGTSSGSAAEDSNGDVVPSGEEVTKVLAELAGMEALKRALFKVGGLGVGDGAVSANVSDHHELAVIVDLENVTGEEAVRDREEGQVLAVHNEGLEGISVSIAISEGIVTIVNDQVDAGTLLRAGANAGPIGNRAAGAAAVMALLRGLGKGSGNESAGGEDQRPELHSVVCCGWPRGRVTGSVYIQEASIGEAFLLFMRLLSIKGNSSWSSKSGQARSVPSDPKQTKQGYKSPG